MNNTNQLSAQKPADKVSQFVVDLGLIGLYAEAHLSLARRLLTGKERVDRVLAEDQLEGRAEYMAALPQLCGEVKRYTDLALRQCQEMLQSPECRKLQSELETTYHVLYQLFSRFSYQDKVLDGMILSVPESRRQLDLCYQLGRQAVDGSHSGQSRN